MAGGTWDKLEQVFQERVARALGQLGVYTSADVERLTARVNELSEAVNALLKAQGIKRPSSTAPVKKKAGGAARPASRTATTGAAEKTGSKATKSAKRTVKVASKPAKAATK